MARLVGFLIVLIFPGVGAALAAYGLYSVVQSHRAQSWPIARGEIESCKLESSRNKDSYSYACRVNYSYQIGTHVYHGDRLAFGYCGTNNERYHKQIEQRLKKSRYVQVHFNPHNPSDSVLSTGPSHNTWLPVAFGTAWLTFFGGIGLIAFAGTSVGQMRERLTKLNQPSPLKNRS